MDIFSITQAAEEAVNETTKAGIAGMFGLNWQLFLAQLVNFGIVMLVLWKWVFAPVTRALQKRTQRIEESLRNAESVDVQKQEFETWKSKEIGETRKTAGEIISRAKVDAESLREQILATTKQEQEKLLQDGQKALARDKEQILQGAKEELAGLATAMAEKILQREITGKDNDIIVKKTLSAIKK